MSEKTQVAAVSEQVAGRTLKGIHFKLRRNTSSNWGSSTEVLAQGEPCAEILSDGRIAFKIGDGVNQWANLPYAICAVDDGEL